jgi:hypothetical protein
VPLQVIE